MRSSSPGASTYTAPNVRFTSRAWAPFGTLVLYLESFPKQIQIVISPTHPAETHGVPPKGAPQYCRLFSSLISQTYRVPFHPFYSSCHLTCQLCRYLRRSAIHSPPQQRFIHCAAKAPHRSYAPTFPQLRVALPANHIATHRLHIPFKPRDKSSCAIFVYLPD